MVFCVHSVFSVGQMTGCVTVTLRGDGGGGGGRRGGEVVQTLERDIMSYLVCTIHFQYQQTQCSTLTRQSRWSYRTCKTLVVPHPPARSGPHLRPTKDSSYVHRLFCIVRSSTPFQKVADEHTCMHAYLCACRYYHTDKAGVYSDGERHF